MIKYRGLMWLRVAGISCVILAALGLTVLRGLFSGLSFYQEELEATLSQRFGTSISLGSLSADLIYLDPQLTIRDLQLGATEDDQMRIQEMSMRLNTVSSLLSGGPVLRDLKLVGLVGDLRLMPDGRWRLSGLKVPETPGKFDYIQLMEQSERVQVQSLVVRVQGGQPFSVTSGVDGQGLRLVIDREQRILSGGLRLTSSPSSPLAFNQDLSMIVRFEASSGSLFSTDFEAYLRFTGEASTGEASKVQNRGAAMSPDLGRHGLDAEIWARSEGGEGSFNGSGLWVSQFAVPQKSGDADLALASGLTGSFSLSNQSMSFLLNQPELTVIGQTIDLGALGIVGHRNQDGSTADWAGWMDHMEINLAASQRLIELASMIGLPKAATTRLEKTTPQFRFEDLQWSGSGGRFRETFSVVSDLKELQVVKDGPVPGIEGLAGFVKVGLDLGYLDLNAGPMGLEFGQLYQRPWALERGLGRLAYRVTDDGLSLTSGKLLAQTKGLRAEGKLQMNLTEARRDRTWGLVIGASDFDFERALPFVPATVPESAVQWLEENLMAGTAGQAGIFVHGSLDRISPKLEKRYGVQAQLTGGVVRYDPAWPLAADVVGRIGVTNAGLTATDLKSTIYETKATNAELSMPFLEGGSLSVIQVEADFKGPVDDVLRLFQETPLSEAIQNAADEWSGQGAVSGSFEIEVPIGLPGQRPIVETNLMLDDVALELSNLGLTVERVRGRLNYQSTSGVTANDIGLTLFDAPVLAQITTELSGNGGTTLIDLAGRIEMSRLNDWLALTLLNFVSGETAYSGRLSIPFGGRDDQPELEIYSVLEGITIDVPLPLEKAEAKTARAFRLSQRFQSNSSELAFDMDSSVGGILKLRNNDVVGGVIEVGGYQPKASAFDAVRIIGSLPYASLEAWDVFLQRVEDVTAPSVESQFRNSLESVRVQVSQFDLFGYELNDVDLGLYPRQDHWQMTLKNEEIDGSVRLKDDAQAPLEIALASVNFESTPSLEDPLRALSADDLMLADVTVASVMLDDEDYGAWQFSILPGDGVVFIENLKATTKGMRIDVPAGLSWYPKAASPYSVFEGLVVIDDMRESLESWGFASGLEGQDFKYQTAIRWPGSPLNISIEGVKGLIEIDGGQGRIIQGQADTGALKLLGIFDFAEIAQRLSFDLSKILGEGHAFNDVTGSLSVDQGLVTIQDPIIIAGAGSQLTLAGDVNLLTEVLDNDLIFTLPVNKNLPWYAAYSAIVTGPLMGAGVLLAQKVFKKQINELTSLKYEVSGTLEQPEVKLVGIFDDSIRPQAASEGGADDSN